MTIATRIAAIYVSIIGLAVMVHFIAVPLYHPGRGEPYEIWSILNYFMAAAILIALVGAAIAKRRHDADPDADAAAHITVNAIFYAVITVGIAFFWNWASVRSADDIIIANLPADIPNLPIVNDLFSNNPGSGNLLIWNFIDITLPVILFPAGRQLWRLSNQDPSPAPNPAPRRAPHVVSRILGAYVLLIALVLAIKFIGKTPVPSWTQMNIVMALGILISLGAAIYWKAQDESGGGHGGDVRRFLDINLPLHLLGGLLIAFFFQWFAVLTDHVQVLATIGDRPANIASLWAYIDVAYIPITGMIGVRLLLGTRETPSSED